MTVTIWMAGPVGRAPGLAPALQRAGLRTANVAGTTVAELAGVTYDGRGLIVLDARDPEGRRLLAAPDIHALPVIAVADEDEPLPGGVLRLVPGADADALAHHVREVVNEPRNLRRHPRVPVDLPVAVNGEWVRARDASLYGIRVSPDPGAADGAAVELTVRLDDGATIGLEGRVVARRGEGSAIRCRPCSDQDLLLWLHLILGGLAHSPLHADADPDDLLFADGA